MTDTILRDEISSNGLDRNVIANQYQHTGELPHGTTTDHLLDTL